MPVYNTLYLTTKITCCIEENDLKKFKFVSSLKTNRNMTTAEEQRFTLTND